MDISEKYKLLDEETKLKLSDLCGQLSPENFSCDGELSEGQMRAKMKIISKQWTDIENQLGFEIEPEDYEFHEYELEKKVS
jgi:hypothetical protein